MQGKLMLVAGLAVGYVVGTRRGRDGYDQLTSRAKSLWGNPRVQKTVGDAQQVVKSKVPVVGRAISDAVDEAKKISPDSDSSVPGNA
jgi:hypothetical protein